MVAVAVFDVTTPSVTDIAMVRGVVSGVPEVLLKVMAWIAAW